MKEWESYFVNWLTAGGYAKTTIESYQKTLKPFWKFLLAKGLQSVEEITTADIVDYQVKLIDYVSPETGKKLSSWSHKARLVSIMSWCQCLYKSGRIAANPTAGIEFNRPSYKLPMLPTSRQIQKLLSMPDLTTLRGVRDRTILEVFWSSGPRVSEILSITCRDVDLGEGLLHIKHGKGDRPRVVPLGKGACLWLEHYLQKVRPTLIRKGQPSSHHVFLSGYGLKLNVSNIPRRLVRPLQKAGYAPDPKLWRTLEKAKIKELLKSLDTNDPIDLRDCSMIELFCQTDLSIRELSELSLERLDKMSLDIKSLSSYLANVRPLLASGQLRQKKAEDILFLNTKGQPIAPRQWQGQHALYIAKAGLSKRFSPHSFRHVLATEMLKAGADLRYVQEMLGHEDLTTTQQYTHIIKEELKRVHRRTHPREQLPLAPVIYGGSHEITRYL